MSSAWNHSAFASSPLGDIHQTRIPAEPRRPGIIDSTGHTCRTGCKRQPAMRSQANTARLLADNPVLMRLRELEVLERIATAGRLNVVLGEHGPGEKGLADRVVNLL